MSKIRFINWPEGEFPDQYLLIKVGSDTFPATDEQLEHMSKYIKGVIADDMPVLLVEHTVNVELRGLLFTD